MARLRYNGLSNSLGASLTNSGTTITFASKLTYAGGDVPTITGSDYIPLSILDADGLCAEVVHLTAYTSAATTGTIARGKEDTSGVAHDSGRVVVNGATRDDLRAVACSVYRNTSQAVANNTWTAVTFPSEYLDTDTMHDTSTNTDRVTVPVAGIYMISSACTFDTSATGVRQITYSLNGTATGDFIDGTVSKADAASASSTSLAGVAFIQRLAASDIIRMFAYHTAGASLDIVKASLHVALLSRE